MFRIRIHVKGTEPTYILTDNMSEHDVDQALARDIPDKLGTGEAIKLPGVSIRGVDVVAAQKVHPSRPRRSALT